MMNRPFDTVTIIGVGLLGGSLGLALKARGLAGRIRGVGHRQTSLDKALEKGTVDEVYLDARAAAKGADLIVICTPAACVTDKMDEILPVCGAETVVTDVASTKAVICSHAERTWPAPYRFVGSHPMAGSEKFGPEYADPTLYEGSVTIVAAGDGVAAEAHQAVCGLWQSVGSKVVEFKPALHDALVARSSHIPHVVAACVAELAAAQEGIRPVIGEGFRDVTRIASGRPEVWRDICLTNREAIAEGLRVLGEHLDAARDIISRGAADELDAFFRSAREARARVAE